MPYTTLSSGLTIKVPTRGTRSWAQTILDECFKKISSHDHTGSPKGLNIGTSAISANAVDDTKIRLRNNQYLRGRNAANSADIDIIKVDSSNNITFPSGTLSGSSFSNDSIDDTKIRLTNAGYLTARNAANSADINLLRADSSDNTEVHSASSKDIEFCPAGSRTWTLSSGGHFTPNATNTADIGTTSLLLRALYTFALSANGGELAIKTVDNQNIRFYINSTARFAFDTDGLFFMGNRASVPGGLPTNGGWLYTESGALKFKGSSGTVTTIAVA